MKKIYIITVEYQMTIEAEDIQKAIATACDVELPFYKIDSFSIKESFFEDVLSQNAQDGAAASSRKKRENDKA